MMKMKYLKIPIVYVVVLTIFFCACSDSYDDWEYKDNESEYDYIGRLHNEGLDIVLQKIIESGYSTKSGSKVLPEISQIRQMCHEFAYSKGRCIYTRNSEVWDEEKDLSGLSQPQRAYLLELKNMIKNTTPVQLSDFLKAIRKLESRLGKDIKINDAEKDMLLYIMAVCRYSACYWTENYEKWKVRLWGLGGSSSPLIRTRSESVTNEWWEKYKELVWADGMGGVKTGNGYLLEGAIANSIAAFL